MVPEAASYPFTPSRPTHPVSPRSGAIPLAFGVKGLRPGEYSRVSWTPCPANAFSRTIRWIDAVVSITRAQLIQIDHAIVSHGVDDQPGPTWGVSSRRCLEKFRTPLTAASRRGSGFSLATFVSRAESFAAMPACPVATFEDASVPSLCSGTARAQTGNPSRTPS